ncbi:MAG: hypothetical protein ABIK31_06320, partial [candidate division WOR-3 bacterium]
MKNLLYLLVLFLIPGLLYSSDALLNKSEKKEECGTIQALLDFQKGIRRPRPASGPKYVYKTHFIIHFDTVGSNATTRAYAESIGKFFEHAWAKQVDTLGWDAPPPDNNNGGDNRYDVYLRDVGGGVTYGEDYGPDPNQEDITSWIEIQHNNLAWCRAGVPHEFNHACQFSYSGGEGGWWYENTSEWMEKITVGIDHGRIGGGGDNPDPLDDPHVTINYEGGGYQYAGGLWPRFLGEYWAVICPRRIWELCGLHWGDYTLKDTDSILKIYYDSNLAKMLGHYAIWRYFTNTRSDNRHFSEGSSYILSAIIRNHNTYPASGDQGIFNPSGPGGCNFITFTNIGNYRLTIYFDGQNGYDWAAYVLGIMSNGESYEYKILLEPTQDTGRISIPGWDYSTVVLIPVVTHWTSTASNLTYSYQVSRSSADKNIASEEIPSDYTGFFISPNPTKNNLRINYFLPHNTKANL